MCSRILATGARAKKDTEEPLQAIHTPCGQSQPGHYAGDARSQPIDPS
jgi:hypothetical protein